MRIAGSGFDFQFSDKKKNPVVEWVGRMLAPITRAINGNLTFGNYSAAGSAPDNIAGRWIEYTTNGVANTEDAVDHSLGVVPAGFLVMIPPKNGFLYTGATAWTSQYLYLKCSQATQVVRIFVLLPPLT